MWIKKSEYEKLQCEVADSKVERYYPEKCEKCKSFKSQIEKLESELVEKDNKITNLEYEHKNMLDEYMKEYGEMSDAYHKLKSQYVKNPELTSPTIFLLNKKIKELEAQLLEQSEKRKYEIVVCGEGVVELNNKIIELSKELVLKKMRTVNNETVLCRRIEFLERELKQTKQHLEIKIKNSEFWRKRFRNLESTLTEKTKWDNTVKDPENNGIKITEEDYLIRIYGRENYDKIMELYSKLPFVVIHCTAEPENKDEKREQLENRLNMALSMRENLIKTGQAKSVNKEQPKEKENPFDEEEKNEGIVIDINNITKHVKKQYGCNDCKKEKEVEVKPYYFERFPAPREFKVTEICDITGEDIYIGSLTCRQCKHCIVNDGDGFIKCKLKPEGKLRQTERRDEYGVISKTKEANHCIPCIYNSVVDVTTCTYCYKNNAKNEYYSSK